MAGKRATPGMRKKLTKADSYFRRRRKIVIEKLALAMLANPIRGRPGRGCNPGARSTFLDPKQAISPPASEQYSGNQSRYGRLANRSGRGEIRQTRARRQCNRGLPRYR